MSEIFNSLYSAGFVIPETQVADIKSLNKLHCSKSTMLYQTFESLSSHLKITKNTIVLVMKEKLKFVDQNYKANMTDY